MKKALLTICFLFAWSAYAHAQSPGVTSYPGSLDTNSSLLTQVNGCRAVLNSSVSTSDTTFTLVSTTCLPSVGVAWVDSEYLTWTGKTSTTITGVSRGAYSTTAASHAAGATLYLTVVAVYHNVLKDGLIATQTKIGTGSSTPTSGKVLGATGTGTSSWRQIVNADIDSAAAIGISKLNITGTPTGTKFLRDDGSWQAAAAASLADADYGDITVSGSGSTLTIDSGVVSNAKLANVATATFKGRTTAGTGVPEDLTATQATALLNNFVGDSGSGGTKGLVPAPSAGDAAASKFLKADGTWAAASGSGLNPTGSSTTNGDITLVGQAVAGGDVLLDLTPAANTAVAAEVPNFILRAATTTTNATVADFSFAKFLAPTLASDSSRTTTNSATVYIANAPTAGTNITITNPYSLWVDNGNVRFDGFLGVGTTAPATTQFYVKAQSSGNVTARIDAASGSTVDILQVQRNASNVFLLDNLGLITHTPATSTAATPRVRFVTSAETTLGTGAESPWIRFGGNSSGSTVSRQWNTGSLTLQRENIFVGPTYAFVGASTLTDAITVDVGTPTAGTNATITRSTGLRVKPAAAAHHGIWVDGTISYTGDALALGQSGAKIVRFVGSGGTLNAVLKADGALASNATDGFTYLPEYAATGAPSGTPTAYTGAEPIVFQKDTINAVYDLWTYSNSAWRSIGGQFKRYDTVTGTGAQTLDFNSSSSANVTRIFTFGAGTATLTFSNPPPAGSLITVVMVQDSGGSRTVTWPASVKWVGGAAPTLTTTANAKDVFQFVWTGSEYLETGRNLDVK